MDHLFDTPEKIDNAISDFTSLIDHPGWRLYVKILDANIDLIKKELEDGFDGETVESVIRLRDKLKVFKETRDKPQELIKKFQTVEDTPPQDDPYYSDKAELDTVRGLI